MEHTATTLSLLEALGFLVNYPKSVLEPTQELIFLGFIIEEGAEPPTRENGSDSQGGQSYPGSLTDFCSFAGPAS